MANRDLPQGHSAGHGDDGNASNAQSPDRTRLEKILTKSPLWKKQTLRNIESQANPVASDAGDRESKTVKLVCRLSAQLEERNEEIQRLRLAVSKLENEKTRLNNAHRREVEMHQAELDRLQDAYDQFEKESDSLLNELGKQNERLLHECRYHNMRSLLKN